MASINRIKDVIRQRQARDPEYYSPKAIASRLGVHLITVYKWEAGENPGLENVARLARDLRVPIEALVEWVPDDAAAAV